MKTALLIADIEHILQREFQPEQLQVMDESAQHQGHPGAVSGRPHIAVIIRSQLFAGRSTLNIHRMIYQALDAVIKDSLHALRLDARAGDVD